MTIYYSADSSQLKKQPSIFFLSTITRIQSWLSENQTIYLILAVQPL